MRRQDGFGSRERGYAAILLLYVCMVVGFLTVGQ